MITTTMQKNSDTFASEDYSSAIRRRKRIFLLVALSVMTVASCLALLLPDKFRSVARISVNLEGTTTLEPNKVAAYADQYIAELSERVRSRENLLRIARDPSVFSENEEDLPLPARMGILREGFYLGLDMQTVTSDKGREVELISGFRTGFEGADPNLAEKAAVFFSNSFLAEDRKSRTERAGSTSAFLSKQIAETEARIVEHEQQIAEFKIKNSCCLPELQELNMSTIQRAERDIEGLQSRIRTLEQDRIFLRTQLEEIRGRSVSTDRLEVLEQEYRRLVANYGPEHPDVGRVRREIQALTSIGPTGNGETELSILRTELAEAERKYSDIHPDVRSLRQRIAALEKSQIGESVAGQESLLEDPRYLQLRSSINTIDTELAELRRRTPELRQRISEYERRLARTPQIESEYQALSRKFDTARENFDNLQQQLVIAQQTEALESAEIGARLTELQPAFFPDAPSGPRRLGIIIVGAILAFGAGIGSIFLAEMLDSTVRGSSDIARIMNMVPAATIPVIRNSVTLAATRRSMIRQTLLILAIVIGITSILIWNFV